MPIQGEKIPLQKEREEGRRWLKDIEIFEAGKRNGISYTPQDLLDMELAFVETQDLVDPVFVLNHDDGMNYGFVCNIHTNKSEYTDWRGKPVKPNQRLLADILIDDWLADDFADDKYRRISAELYPDYKHEDTGKIYKWVVVAVSGQGGGNLEAVRTLKPLSISAREGLADAKKQPLHFRALQERKVVTIKFGDDTQMDEELKQVLGGLTAALQALTEGQGQIKAALEALTAKKEEPSEEPEEMKQECADKPAEAKEEMKQEMKQENAEKFSDRELVKLKAEIAALRAVNERNERLNTVRPQIQKFADEKNMKFVPAKTDSIVAFAASLDYKNRVVKFADEKGAAQEKSQYDAFIDVLEGLPVIGLAIGSSGATPAHKEKSNVSGRGGSVQLFSDAKMLAEKGKISEVDAINKLVESLPFEQQVQLMLGNI